MNLSTTQQTVDISPGVSILSILKYIEYDHWFAIAEFIDNAIDSYLKNRQALHEIEGDEYQLEVSVEIDADNERIVIRDNAAGIAVTDYARAFRAAERPPDASQLSEFGMGMKTAACWYSDCWTVRTTALNEPFEKVVRFDLSRIYQDNLSELEVSSLPTALNVHYTVVELDSVFRMPRGQTLTKIKRHLESIYREFTRNGTLKLKLNGEILSYITPRVLEAPIYSAKDSTPIVWRREIAFDVEEGLSVHGFVALREQGSTSEAGLALFRRGRVIQGSYDQAFRPEILFGKANSYRYQRVFGELHLEGFQVSFTKRGFQADENMDVFLQLLYEELNHDSFPLLKQAEHYRARSTEANYSKMAAPVLKAAVDDMNNCLPEIVSQLRASSPLPVTPASEEIALPTITEGKGMQAKFSIRYNSLDWEISIELSYETSLSAMYEVGDIFIKDRSMDSTMRQIGIRLSLTHPFMVQYVDTDRAKLEPVLRIVAALGLAEVIAKESAAMSQKEIRRNFNELISKLTSIS